MFKNNKFCRDKTFSQNKFIALFFTLLLVLFISACSETDDASTELGSSKKAANGTTLYLKLVDDTTNELIRNLDQNQSSSVVATLKNTDDEPIEGVVVELSTNLGTLAATNGLTQSDGRATVTLAAGTAPKAGEITAAVNVDGVEITVSYGFAVGGTVDPGPNPNPSPEPEPGTPVSKSNDGAMEFVSAAPQKITLKSAGGAGLSELSTVTFRLVGIDGLPLANQTVIFSINNVIGGITIDPASATTGFDGLVSTVVHAGTVPTSLRITATATISDGTSNDGTSDNIVFAQSDMLAVGVGTPDQNSMSLSLSNHAPEAWRYDGKEVDVTVRLGDHFNNFIPDGTSVYFTTEGGVIEPSCETVNSACTVKWLSSNPRPADHRVTILATTLGSESFQDTDSDGVYSQADGEPFTDINGNRVYDEPFTDENNNGKFDEPFVAMLNGVHDPGEEFVDAFNGVYDFGEPFVDTLNQVYDSGEAFTDENNNLEYDLGEPFVDALNGFWNIGEEFTDQLNGRYDDGELFTDTPIYSLGVVFVDRNGNGVHDGDRFNPLGEESFIDSNSGNGLYDGSGNMPLGEASFIFDTNENGLFDGPGFADLGEPFLDENENRKHDVDEPYVDTNNNKEFDATGDGKFNGVHCKASDVVCSSNRTLRIRDSAVLVMADSSALAAITAITSRTQRYYIYRSGMENIEVNSPTPYIYAADDSAGITVYYSDSAGQVLPEGTTVTVSSTKGSVTGAPAGGIPNNVFNSLGRGAAVPLSELMTSSPRSFSFNVEDSDDKKIESGVVSIVFTTPEGHSTPYYVDIVL